MTLTRFVTRVLAGLLGGALLLAPASVPAASAATKNLQVMSWNMCGSQRSTWNCGAYGTPQDKIDVVKYHVDRDYVQAILLQEVCKNDLALLMTTLGAGWSSDFAPYQWSQDGVRWDSRCGDDDGRSDPIGTAVVVKAGMSDARTYAITEPWTGLNDPFHCVTATYWNVRLCSVHLAAKESNPDHPEWEYADDQMVDIKNIVSGFPDVVFGGDFNVQSPDLPGYDRAWVWPADLYYAGEGTSGYQECDQDSQIWERTGRVTHDSNIKIDYIFTSEKRRWCAVADSKFSDHHVMISSIEVG